MKAAIFFLLSFILFSQAGCKSKTHDSGGPDTLSYRFVNIEDTLSKGQLSLSVEISYPEIPDKEKNAEKINNIIRKLALAGLFSDKTFDSPERLKDSLLYYENPDISEDAPPYVSSWMVNRDFEVAYNKDGIFSFKYDSYMFTGGAHGLPNQLLMSLDVSSGNKIELLDILVDNSQEKLRKIAEAKFRQLKNLRKDEELTKAGYWFENNRFFLPENFLVSGEGLVFVYNVYEIAPYSDGPTELIIPWRAVEDITNENFKKIFLK